MNESYTYAAVFHPTHQGYSVVFPQLPDCVAQGHTYQEAMDAAAEALAAWLRAARESGEPVPPADLNVTAHSDDLVVLVVASAGQGKRRKKGPLVKRMVTLPSWLDAEAGRAGLDLSRLLQEAVEAALEGGEEG